VRFGLGIPPGACPDQRDNRMIKEPVQFLEIAVSARIPDQLIDRRSKRVRAVTLSTRKILHL